MLLTGDFEELGEENFKSYRDYSTMETETETAPNGLKELGEGIKLYRDYSNSETETE